MGPARREVRGSARGWEREYTDGSTPSVVSRYGLAHSERSGEHPITPPPSTPPTKVLYVIGRGRTGSTLLGNLLAQTPRVAHTGELITLWNIGLREDGRVCGCGEPVLTCPFWTEVADEVLGANWTRGNVQQLEALRRAHVRGRQMPERILSGAQARRRRGIDDGPDAEYADVLRRLYRAIARVAGADLVVDSSKSAAMAAFLPSVPGIDLSFVNIVRDPRAVAFSQLRTKDLPSGQTNALSGALTQTYPPHRSARQWLQRQFAAGLILGRHPRGRRQVLRYEDLVTDPQASIDRLRRMLGLKPEPLPFVESNTLDMVPTHTVGGNPSRVRTGPTPIRPDDRWKAELSPSDRRTVTLIAAPLLRRYGYPLGDRPD